MFGLSFTRFLLVITFVASLVNCKPKADDSDLLAIVGQENGKNKAMAIIPMRNKVETRDSIPKAGLGKAVLDKVYEVVYGLVECSDSKKAKADTWMNLLEFYGMSQVLYVDGNRRIHVNQTTNGKSKKSYFNSCVVVGRNFLTLPMLLSSAGMVDEFPGEEPNDSDLKSQYLLLQSIYLAIRGPYTKSGKFAIGPSLVGMAANSKSYPKFAFSESQMGKTFKGSDYFYNPCVKNKVKARYGYMQKWKHQYYSCQEASASKGVFNYKPGGKTGYTKVKEVLKHGMLALYASTHGGITSKSKQIDKFSAALLTTESWSDVKGPAKLYAQFLMGKSGYQATFNRSFGLTSAAEDEAGSVGFGLADTAKDPKEEPEDSISAQIKRRLARDAENNRLLGYVANPSISPNFSRFTLGDEESLKRYGARTNDLSQTYSRDVQKKLDEIRTEANAAIKRENYTGDDLITARAYEMSLRSNLLQEFSNEVKGDKSFQGASTFLKKDYKKEFGVESIRSMDGSTILSQGAKGKLTEFNKMDSDTSGSFKKENATVPKDATLWRDRTIESEGAKRTSWQKDGLGGQVVETPGLKIQSDFIGNKREDGTRSSVGHFELNPTQLGQSLIDMENLTGKLESNSKKALSTANTTAEDIQTNRAKEQMVQDALSRTPGPLTKEDSEIRDGALADSAARKPSNWDQLRAGFGQMGTGLQVAHDATAASKGIKTQADLLDSEDSTSNAIFNSQAAAAQQRLQTVSSDGANTAFSGLKTTATATQGLASDAYQNPYVKTTVDLAANTTIGRLGTSAWGAASNMWNNSGGGQPANAAPGNQPPANQSVMPPASNIQAPDMGGMTNSPYGNTTAPDSSGMQPTSVQPTNVQGPDMGGMTNSPYGNTTAPDSSGVQP